MGKNYEMPFGIAPIGMSGLIWPDAERILARAAAEASIPYCLSSMAARTPEETGPLAQGMGWFQLYMPKSSEIRDDILRRVQDAQFDTLVLTLDVPGESRRERQRRAHLSVPMRITPSLIASILVKPYWALGMMRMGPPRMKLAEGYLNKTEKLNRYQNAAKVINGYPSWDDIATIRKRWKGKLVAKGVLDPETALRLKDLGVDAVWVSNHGARQFDGGPASITMLPAIREAVGADVGVLFDSGISGGLDILRALSLGADFVFLGRAFHYALGALGHRGPSHLIDILRADLVSNMKQIGARNFDELAARTITFAS